MSTPGGGSRLAAVIVLAAGEGTRMKSATPKVLHRIGGRSLLGHAIEQVEHYRIPHGHAVSIGLVFAAALGNGAGRLDAPTARRHREVLDVVGLPTIYPLEALPALLTAMRSDKKARGSVQRFVVLDGLGRPGILENPSRELLEAAYAEVAR